MRHLLGTLITAHCVITTAYCAGLTYTKIALDFHRGNTCYVRSVVPRYPKTFNVQLVRK